VDDAARLADINHRRPLARQRIIEALGTIPAAGGGTGAASGVSDRTGRLACAYLTNTSTDIARQDLDRLIDIEWANKTNGGITRRQLDTLEDIVDRWAPDPRRRQALEANLRAASDDLLNRHDDHGNCRSCRRDPKSYKEPFRRGLCVNCYRRVQRINELYVDPVDMPPLKLVVLFRERGKVSDHDIHNAMHGCVRREP